MLFRKCFGLTDGDDDFDFQYDLVSVAAEDAIQAETKYNTADKEAKAAKQKLKKLEQNKKEYVIVSQDLWMTIQRKLDKVLWFFPLEYLFLYKMS